VNKLFFADIDTQRDFMLPEGALYVPGAERIIPKLQRLFDFARKNEIHVLSTVDAHTPNDPEFEQFPAHCVQGTKGQKKLDETMMPHPLVLKNQMTDRNLVEDVRKHLQIIVEKQALDVFTNPVMDRLLRILPPRAIVFGVTTEYCVLKACLGLCRNGVQTVLVTDAVRAISARAENEALNLLHREGVEFTTMDALMGAGSK